jgi:hypothetical protein
MHLPDLGQQLRLADHPVTDWAALGRVKVLGAIRQPCSDSTLQIGWTPKPDHESCRNDARRCVSSGTGVHAVHPRQIGVGRGPAQRSYGTGSLVAVVGTECRGQCESLVTVAASVNEPVPVFVDDTESVSDSAIHMGSAGCKSPARLAGHERAAEMIEDPLSAYRTFGMPTYSAEAERL